jgi:hypothetical protein
MTDEASTPDDEIDINLRSPREIGTRLVILAALTRRLLIEDANADEESADDLFDLGHWLTEQQLDERATAQERRTIDAALGHIPPSDRVDAEMASESLVTLAWAADLVPEIPPVDEPADVHDLLDRLPSPWESVQPFIDAVRLRPEDEIAMGRERVELWLWRAMIEPERRGAHGQSRTEIDGAIKEAARESHQAGLISDVRAGDFALAGQPFRQITAEQQDLIGVVSAARLRALNWACGFGTSWGEVPLDV